ncbi:MAG TPA: cupin domain-containing protein [Chloroflexota bacterium]|jgi:mannose-6-phosphate isomerase-like protein (cupin superfamily)
MGAEHFCVLDEVQAPVDAGRWRGRLAGEHLELCDWTVAPGEPRALPLDRYAECFVVPLAGALTLAGAPADSAGADTEPAGAPGTVLERGSLAYWPAARGPASVGGAACRYIVVGWPDGGTPAAPAAPTNAAAAAMEAPSPLSAGPGTGLVAPAAPPALPSAADAAAPAGRRQGVWDVYQFDEALVPSAPGWRFFSVDGDYLTVGCSYREAPPPAREQPHSHDGEQINVPLEGRFAFTVGGHTETIAPGWAAITPRGVTHTGLHVEFPYFQLIFATPPRGRDYAEFLRSIYRAPD